MDNSKGFVKSKVLRTAGLAEAEIRSLLGEGFGQNKSFGLKMSPNIDGSVDVIIEVMASLERMALALLEAGEKEVRNKLGDNIYGSEGEKLEEVVGYLLYLRGLSLSVAESCTGGLLSSRITDVPGSSNYYRGGLVAYHQEVKTSLLHIPQGLIEGFGVVSPQAASAMAHGVAELLKTDLGLSITGFAGPGGEKIGLVYIALASKENIKAEKFIFSGDRKEIKEKAVCTALNMIRRSLLG